MAVISARRTDKCCRVSRSFLDAGLREVFVPSPPTLYNNVCIRIHINMTLVLGLPLHGACYLDSCVPFRDNIND